MAVFMQWIDIVEGCPMPRDGDEVLITIWSDGSYGKGTNFNHYVDLGTYRSDGSGYLGTNIPGCGFDTENDWDEGQPIKVVAWMPLPKPRVNPLVHLSVGDT